MRIAGEFTGRFAGMLVMVFSLAVNLVTGKHTNVNEAAIQANRQKAAGYSQGLDTFSTRQMPHQ